MTISTGRFIHLGATWVLSIIAPSALSAPTVTPAPLPQIHVSRVGGSSYAIDKDGKLWAWGGDSKGELGLGRITSLANPKQLDVPTNVAAVSAGNQTTFAVRSDGTLWAWGDNSFGQLGDGSTESRSAPVKIGSGFKAVNTGGYHTLAIKTDGSLWAWGSNSSGELGDGTTKSKTSPVQIGSGYTAVAAGKGVSFAVKLDTSLWGWGNNLHGGVGDGTRTNRVTPTNLGSGFAAVKCEQTFDAHCAALKTDGSLWIWGMEEESSSSSYLDLDGNGIASDVLSPTRVGSELFSDFAIGQNYLFGLKSDGSIWMLRNYYGGSQFRIATGYRLITERGGAISSDGELVEFRPATTTGQPSFVGTSPVNLGNGFLSVSAGFLHSIALKADGSVWTWGSNQSGQLGVGQPIIRPTPVEVGTNFRSIATGANLFAGTDVYAIKSDGTLWQWGAALTGAAGAPAQIGTGYVAVATSGNHVLALKDDGGLWTWGWNAYGQLGDGTTQARTATSPYLVGNGFTSAVTSGNFSLALKADGTVWAWGLDRTGELGSAATDTCTISSTAYPCSVRPTRVGTLSGITQIAAGESHALALTGDGSVWSWGTNSSGELGDGTLTNRTAPSMIGAGYSAISAGIRQSIGLKPNGSLWGWGNYFRSGNNSTADTSRPTQIATNVTVFSSSASHTMVGKVDGSLWAWGQNNSGQLGNGTLSFGATVAAVVNEGATGYFALSGASLGNSLDPFKLLQIVAKSSTDLNTKITDVRATGFTGDIYFTALLPSGSPIISKRGQRAGTGGMVPVALTRSGFKQTGPGVAAEANSSGAITSGSQYTIYEKAGSDPLVNSNAVICMGLALPALTAKGQVLVRAIATGDQVQGVVQCPTVQTTLTTQMYTAQTIGPITARTIVATINPLAEDRGQSRNLYSWAVAPDGTQYMQTGPNSWSLMAEPMLPAMTVTVPATGSITLPVTNALNLSSISGTLVYVGMGSSWDEVRNLNQAGHYYTVQ